LAVFPAHPFWIAIGSENGQRSESPQCHPHGRSDFCQRCGRSTRSSAQRLQRGDTVLFKFIEQLRFQQLFIRFVPAGHKRHAGYFVDDRSDPNISNDVVDSNIPQRSDIRTDTEGSAGTQSGLPLYLTITVGDYSSGACSPISGAQVHVWHCNVHGVYSDVRSYTAEDFLRGYQWTDSNGQVTFTTIYPGWYSGRTVHIHVKVRIFDSSGKVTTEATTQLFFNDSTSDAVYAANPPIAAPAPVTQRIRLTIFMRRRARHCWSV